MRTDNSYLDEMRLKGDVEADKIILHIFSAKIQSQLYTLLSTDDIKIEEAADGVVKDFILHKKENPTWIDKNTIKAGQLFFRKHALEIMSLLGSMSLPYCYAASPGNKAIYLTEKMRHQAAKRLVDTAHFIITVMEPGSFENGVGFIQVNKTRLIHALVRYHIGNKGIWNMQWGLPVNQEDMAGTNLAFSYIILVGLKRAKYKITEREAESFLHAWRYIGYLLDIEDNLLPANSEEAKQLEESIRKRNFTSSEEGKVLTQDLVNHYRNTLPSVPAYFVDAQIRYCIGPEISNLLGLNPEPVKDFFVSGMNKLKEKINSKYVYPKSYDTMMRNHLRLKKLYG